MDFDALWDAWTAAGHEECGGWRHDPGPGGGVITCACRTVIPQAGARSPLPAEEIMPDTGPGMEWYRELADEDAGKVACDE
jgi:hypothetical protein